MPERALRLSDRALLELAAELGERLKRAQCTLATAESCTGGWIGKVLTDVAGSSDWFGWGWISYADAAKRGMLGIAPELLAGHGAVSEPVAAAMAVRARDLSGADFALAVTGIAGPGGGSPAKPVGTVWFAWAGATTRTELKHFGGGRAAVRRAAVTHALAGVAAHLLVER
jgi:nicotinamide-nucleotide amidase